MVQRAGKLRRPRRIGAPRRRLSCPRLGVLIDAVFNHLGPSGNYLPKYGPYLTEANTGWGPGRQRLRAGADEVRQYILDCALRWMRDFHTDGLRLDAVHALADHTAIHILEEMSAETDSLAEQLGVRCR